MYDRKVMTRLFWTILSIITMCIMSLMIGCSERVKQKEVKVYNINELNTDYAIYVIDSCEYVIFYSGSSTWGSHKGNCSNPKHANH